MAGRPNLSKVAKSLKSEPQIDVSKAISSIFTPSGQDKERTHARIRAHFKRQRQREESRKHMDEARGRAPERETLPLWKADKKKSEAFRLFRKGFITKQEARQRIVDAEAGFQAFMRKLQTQER